MNDELETIRREIAFRNNAIKKIAEMEWELPQLRDISHGLDAITFNIENLIKIIDIQHLLMLSDKKDIKIVTDIIAFY